MRLNIKNYNKYAVADQSVSLCETCQQTTCSNMSVNQWCKERLNQAQKPRPASLSILWS